MGNWTNDCAAHRHAAHALADFLELQKLLTVRPRSFPADLQQRLHSISHHLRHAVFRTGARVPARYRRIPRRVAVRLRQHQ